MLVRLLIALVLGAVVAWVYRRTRSGADFTASFPPTLVLLAVLIAMVTQVIGDNVARAFSLVGALSIVRFRTVVRDTQDTAFVIFAVVVGMAVGASDPWVAMIGIAVVELAAFLMMHRPSAASAASETPFRLELRVATGHDLNGPLAAELEPYRRRQETAFRSARPSRASRSASPTPCDFARASRPKSSSRRSTGSKASRTSNCRCRDGGEGAV